jgi:hypothetical protein
MLFDSARIDQFPDKGGETAEVLFGTLKQDSMLSQRTTRSHTLKPDHKLQSPAQLLATRAVKKIANID